MPALLYLGLANVACAAALAALALAVGRAAGRPALTHVLWLLVLLKLVTPPLLPLEVARLPVPEAGATATKGAAAPGPLLVTAAGEPELVGPPTPEDVWREVEKTRLTGDPEADLLQRRLAALAALEGAGDAGGFRSDVTPAPAAFEAGPVPAAPAPAAGLAETAAPVATLLGIVWLAGSAAWFARSVWRSARFARLLRHARPAPAPVRAAAERIARRFGLRRCPEVLLLPAPLPPMVWAALGRVRVLVPARLAERLAADQLEALLAHELAHVRRGDHWVRRLEFVVLGLYWWCPLAWWARARLQAAEEECCDAWVVEAVPAPAYAAAILATVDLLADGPDAVPALASGLGRLDGLKRRLTLILTGPAPKRLPVAGRLAVAALGLGLLPLVPTLAAPPRPPDEPAAAEGARAEPGDPRGEALAFQREALDFTSGDHQVAALAVSADGKYLAAGTGSSTRPGEVRVWTAADHKEVLTYATPRGVATVAFAKGNRLIASSGYDGQAVIREFPSGKVVAVLPLGDAARLAFTADGAALITATEAGTVKVWDAKTGGERLRLEGGPTRWFCLAVSPDGKLLATGGGDLNGNKVPNDVVLWDTATFKPVGRLKGHTGAVMSVAFAPDSRTAATGTTDGKAQLWQLDGGKLLATLEGHENWVKALTFTPDGKTLATGSHDGSVRLWDVATGAPLDRLDGHTAPVRSVAVAPDGKRLYTGGAERILKVWDLATRKEVATHQPKRERADEGSVLLATAYAPDGRTLATAHEDGTVRLRSAGNGDLRLTLAAHGDAATCLVFTRDGKTLITGGADNAVRLWDVETGKPRATLDGHTSWVYALALSPDGKTLASAGYDKTVRLWDLAARKEVAKLTGHKGAVRALAFAPDGKTLASGSGDATVKLWDLGTRQETAALAGHEGTVRSVAYAPDGKTLASGSEDGTTRLWDAAGAAKAVLKDGGRVSAVAFSPRGRYVVSGNADARCRLWDTTTGQLVQTLSGNADAVTCLAWAPDGRFVVTGGHERALKLWVVTTGVLRTLTGHKGPVNAAAFSPDGKHLLSCGGWPHGDKTLRLWDAEMGKEVRQFEGHTDQIGWAAFSSDGKRVLSGGSDKTARLWDVETGKTLHVLSGHEDRVAHLAFSADGRRAATAGHDKTVRVWDLDTGECLHVLRGHGDSVRGVAFTPDGKRVVSGSRDGELRVWDAAGGAQVERIGLPEGPVNALALSPDGKRVATVGDAVRVIDLGTGKTLRELDGHGGKVLGVAWSPEGKAVLTGGQDATARLWDVETGRELHVFRGHRNWIWAVNFAADGRRVVTAGGGNVNNGMEVAGTDFALRVWPVPGKLER